MDAVEAYRGAIENIKNGMECPKGFACCQAGFEQRCPARVLASGTLLECLEDTHRPCPFAVDFGIGRFCECPLRVLLLQNPSCGKRGHA